MCERAAHRHWSSAACSSPTPLTQATTLSTTRHAPSTTKDHQRAHRIHRSKRSSRGHETHPHHTCRADAGQTTPHASEIHAVGDSLRPFGTGCYQCCTHPPSAASAHASAPTPQHRPCKPVHVRHTATLHFKRTQYIRQELVSANPICERKVWRVGLSQSETTSLHFIQIYSTP